jgi:hypothetical protein
MDKKEMLLLFCFNYFRFDENSAFRNYLITKISPISYIFFKYARGVSWSKESAADWWAPIS